MGPPEAEVLSISQGDSEDLIGDLNGWGGQVIQYLQVLSPFCASRQHKPNLATGPDRVLRSPGNLATTPSFTSGFQHLTPFMVS